MTDFEKAKKYYELYGICLEQGKHGSADMAWSIMWRYLKRCGYSIRQICHITDLFLAVKLNAQYPNCGTSQLIRSMKIRVAR